MFEVVDSHMGKPVRFLAFCHAVLLMAVIG